MTRKEPLLAFLFFLFVGLFRCRITNLRILPSLILLPIKTPSFFALLRDWEIFSFVRISEFHPIIEIIFVSYLIILHWKDDLRIFKRGEPLSIGLKIELHLTKKCSSHMGKMERPNVLPPPPKKKEDLQPPQQLAQKTFIQGKKKKV